MFTSAGNFESRYLAYVMHFKNYTSDKKQDTRRKQIQECSSFPSNFNA
jgi:hypothetical protein